MCDECQAAFETVSLTPTLRGISRLIQLLYQTQGSGGCLHIVLDDWNLEDDHISFCQKYILESCEHDGATQLLEKALVDLLLPLNEDERATSLGHSKV